MPLQTPPDVGQVERTLERIWSEVLGRDGIGARDNFFDLGGHSLLAADLFARIETQLGVRLPLSSLFPDATLAAQAALIAHTSPLAGSAVVPIQPTGSLPPFICVHAIDGDVLRFEPLARALGPDQPFYGLRARGLSEASEPLEDVWTIAATYIDDLLEAGFDEPFSLGGFSNGCSIAFEMACQLRERGKEVALLALFDGVAPNVPGGRAERAARALQQLGPDLRAYVADIVRSDRPANRVGAKLRDLPRWFRRQLTTDGDDQELLTAVAGLSERHLAVALALQNAARRYLPRRYPGRLTLFRARVRLLFSSHDRSLGWNALAGAGVEVHAAGGEHADMLREPHVQELADQLRACLRRTPAGQASGAADFVPFDEAAVEQSIPARFEQQVEAYPHRLALQTGTRRLTYAQLNALANRIGRSLLGQTPARGQHVALLFRDQALMVAASFGALKAGRAYVSLDPTYPRARQEFILDDAEAGVILTDSDRLEQARELARGRIVLDVGALAADGPSANIGLHLPPDTVAYIVYTSGSTGQPKGVLENHRNVLHFTFNNTNTWRICASDRISLLVPYWFSAAATATFAALLNGAALLPFEVKEHGLLALADWLNRQRITIFHTSTSLLRYFLRSLPEHQTFPTVRLVYQGSEALYRSDVEMYRRHFSDACLTLNSLGASEMKQFSVLRIDRQTQLHERVVPVGYPVPGAEVLVVDEQDQPVAQGEVGEIVVRSQYVSPGYWRRPELTARAFRADPADPHVRRYWTGDLGWIDERGCLHHVGRKDFQIKIRGYRVELGEAAAALQEFPDVEEAVVVVHEDAGAPEPRLVAYVVGQPGLVGEELRRRLEDRLPEYMLPSEFVFVEAIPRNANGKVDTPALRAAGRAPGRL